MEPVKNTSETASPKAATTTNDAEVSPKPWITPELVKMDLVDSTKAGGVVRALPESVDYRPS